MAPLPEPPKDRRREPVALEPWAVLFVTGESRQFQPNSCLNCHMLIAPTKRCAIHGKGIAIDTFVQDGDTFTPVCGLHDFGKPMKDEMYPAENDPDLMGLVWVRGKGTNCGGVAGGLGCTRHYTPNAKGMGFCRVLGKPVGAFDCCAANEPQTGKDIVGWREAQRRLGETR